MASFVGFSEPVLAEELPKPSVQTKTGPKKQRNRSGKEKAARGHAGLLSQGHKGNSSSSINLLARGGGPTPKSFQYGAATVRNKAGAAVHA